MRETLRNLRHRRDCCEPCQAPCPASAPAPKCVTTCAPACAPSCGFRLGHGHKSCTSSSCATTTCATSTCDSGHGHGAGLLSRLRGLFQRRCDSCDSCAPSSAVPHSESIAPPKKMPAATPPAPAPAPKGQVRIDTPIQAPLPQAAPFIESQQAPAVVPSIDDIKSPF